MLQYKKWLKYCAPQLGYRWHLLKSATSLNLNKVEDFVILIKTHTSNVGKHKNGNMTTHIVKAN